MAQRMAAITDDVTLSVDGMIGVITLDRKTALNALSEPMCLAIDQALAGWAHDPDIAAVLIRGAGERAFCAGGDVRAVCLDGIAHRRGESDGRLAREFFANEYRMNRRIRIFPKPYIALIDGITMGGGFGLSVYGSHRVATERTLLAMPETGIGFFPDVGASYVLSRLEGNLGLYLALTGARLTGPDLMHLGLATHLAPSAELGLIHRSIVTAVDEAASKGADARGAIDRALMQRASASMEGALNQHRAMIERCFGCDRIEEMLAALDVDGGAFATAAAAAMRAASPTSLKLTLEEMRRGRVMDFDSCLRMEYRLSQAVLEGSDFYEGVRAQLIDKDRTPAWSPASLAEVNDAAVESVFAWNSVELTFPD
jgi:enoyl-CoA hydratase